MDIPFNWPAVQTQFTQNMNAAISFGNEEVAGCIAGMMVAARHAFDSLDAGEPRSTVIERLKQHHQAIHDHFLSEA